MDTTLVQPYTFLIFLYGGAVTGLLYDVCRLVRLALARFRLGFAGDLLFVLLFGAVTAATFVAATSGQFRFYGVCAMLLGVHIETVSIRRLLIPSGWLAAEPSFHRKRNVL